MKIKDILNFWLNKVRKVKLIEDPINKKESEDGEINDLTSRAFYKSQVIYNRNEIERISKYVEQYSKMFEQVKQQYEVGTKEYNNARDEMYRWIVRLDEIKAEQEFIRPNTQEDIKYRDEIVINYPNKLKEALSPNLDLRFHSTSISATKQIIQSKQITSVPDRYDGYIKNSDGEGIISASTRNDIVRTITHYSHLNDYTSALPAGCVFALFPKDKSDAANYGRNEISSVNFTKNPEQLFGIITTPENIKRVKEWLEKSQLNPDLVYTHQDFLEVVKLKSSLEDKKAEFKNKIKVNEEDIAKNIKEEKTNDTSEIQLSTINNEKEKDKDDR